MMETRVRGKSIAKYQLTYYRSLRLNVTNKEAGQLRQLLGLDTEQSIDWRTSRKNPHSWDTWTCKMQMPSAGNKNRFLCYQEEWDKEHEQCKLTVIYMEGTVGSLEELEERSLSYFNDQRMDRFMTWAPEYRAYEAGCLKRRRDMAELLAGARENSRR
jgi:hypothetical protein